MSKRLAVVALVVLVGPAAWAAFTREQLAALTSPSPRASKYPPKVSAQIFYHYFDSEPDPKTKPPDWFIVALKTMRKRRVWKDPSRGEMTEAELWQEPAAVLYDFFKLTQKTFPKTKGGQSVPPGKLIQDYEIIRARFGPAVDRLYLSRLGASMDGRGSDLMTAFRRILVQMRAINSALLLGDEVRYADSVLEICSLTWDTLDILDGPAPKH